MRAINHSLTGAVIGLSVSDPLIAVPLAFVSHYVLDVVPHYSLSKTKDNPASAIFIFHLIVDALLCLILVSVIVLDRPLHWLTAIICAFVAALPDLFNFNLFYRKLKNKPWKPNAYTRLAHKIQWFEKPIGIVVEAVWFVSLIFCLSIFLRN